MALYFDRAIVDDPLLSISRPSRDHAALSEFIGGAAADKPLDRQALAEAVDFLSAVRPLVKAGFLTIAPIGIANDPPPQLPLLYSPTLFEERVPAPLREWFHSRARVFALEQTDQGWISRDRALAPCRSIGIVFDGLRLSMMFQLFPTTPTAHSDDPAHFTYILEKVDEPPAAKDFDIWVRQSVNQFAGNVYAAITRDVINATSIEAMLLTDSALVVDLLSQGDSSLGIDQQVAQLVLQLQLPVLDGISESELMRVRGEDPASFETFRIQLDRGLTSISAERDETTRKRKLEEFRHDMSLKAREAQVAAKRLRRAMTKDIALGAISLTASYFAGGVLAAGALLAARDAIKRWSEFQNSVQATPGHFLLKLQQAQTSNAE
jgi:hypothetical protein